MCINSGIRFTGYAGSNHVANTKYESAGFLGPPEHPTEGNVGKAGALSAPHIGMDPGKPNILHVLRLIRLGHQVLPEAIAALETLTAEAGDFKGAAGMLRSAKAQKQPHPTQAHYQAKTPFTMQHSNEQA